MNLAIEYVLRKERIKKMLCLPCSLFLTHDKTKIVITMAQAYGPRTLIVKHWNLVESKANEPLPPFIEFAVQPEELFSSDKIVLKDYQLLQFQEEPFITGLKQHSDPAHGAIQEVEYNSCLDDFLNTKTHKKVKTEWLWESFNETNVPHIIKSQYADSNPDRQRQTIHYYAKPIWNMWEHWRKYLLNFNGPAAELVFASLYGNKPKPLPEPSSMSYYNWNGPFSNSTSGTSGYFYISRS